MVELLQDGGERVLHVWQKLWFPFLVFTTLALIFKRRAALRPSKTLQDETRTNLMLMTFNALLVFPIITTLYIGFSQIPNAPLESLWGSIPLAVSCVLAVIIGDFVGYWRHRFEHLPKIWPSHAVHHSDKEMSWLTLERFHPINRITTYAIDVGTLTLLGLPLEAIIFNGLVRYYWGTFIHMDFKWTFGPLGKWIVSPAMHRWHHVREGEGVGTNFATVLAIWDRGFGTYYLPGPCTVPLGVPDDMGEGWAGQLAYGFSPKAYRNAAETAEAELSTA